MKISSHRLDLKLAHPWTIARTRAMDISNVLIVELADGDDTFGLGEATPISRYLESVDTVEAFCKKVDARRLSFDDVPGSMEYLDTISAADMSAKCLFNVALLDGAAKRAQKPLHDFLGLGFRENHHVTSFTIGIDKPAVIRKKALAAERFPILKVKLGVPGDRDNLKVLREVAPTKWVRVDANEGWKTKEHALEMIEWLSQDKYIQFIEQPMPADTSPKDLAWLKARSPLPLFGDESFHSTKDVSRCADCYHGVNAKLCKTGGVSGAYQALSAARKAGLQTMLGCMIETSIAISAAAHLAELCDYLDLDGNLLITNDPYRGVAADKGILSLANAKEKFGLRVSKG